MAEAHYIDLMPHNPLGPICSAATVHLAAAVPNFAWLEVRVSPTEEGRFYDADWFPVQPELDGYRYIVPDGPGLGVEFNEERAQAEEFSFWEAPHLSRPRRVIHKLVVAQVCQLSMLVTKRKRASIL